MPTGRLTVDPRNTRVHGDGNLKAIVQSLRRFGQQAPIVYVRAGRRRVVKKGNGLLTAARRLRWGYVAAIASDLAGQESAAFAIADNRSSDLSEFDEALLAAQLEELKAEGIQLAAMGFSDQEMEELVSGQRDRADGATAEDGGRRERELKRLEVRFLAHPPAFTWVLVGIPTTEFYKVQEPLENIGRASGAIVRVTVTDAPKD